MWLRRMWSLMLLLMFTSPACWMCTDALIDMDIGDATEVVGLIKSALGVAQVVSDVWNELAANSTGITLPRPGNMSGSSLLRRFGQLSRQLTALDDNVRAARHTLRHVQQGVVGEVRWQLTMETLENLIRPVESNYDRFLYYQLHGEAIEEHTLADFSAHAVSHSSDSLQSIMSSLEHMIKGLVVHPRGGSAAASVSSPSSRRHSRQQRYAFRQGLFVQLQRVLETSRNKMCDLEQSPHQLMYSLYSIVTLTLAKAFTMVQFSFMMLKTLGKGKFEYESRLVTQMYEQISFEAANEAERNIKNLSNVFWRCDPTHHVSGDTYVQLTELLQGFLENEVDLNADGSCNNNCAYYNHTSSKGCYMKRNYMICNHQRPCRGRVHECRFFDSDSTVCFADGKDAAHRRYEWVEFEDGQQLGRVSSCDVSRKVDSWWRNLFWHCSYCFCMCDDATNSDRYFSLHRQIADVERNMVVTGVRWVKRGRVFYLQIEQGSADKYGFVNSSTVHWKPFTTIDLQKDTEGQDFMTLSWERRAVDLDDLRTPAGHVVTGVSLRSLGQHLNLEIQATPISGHTGLVSAAHSYWLSSDLTPVDSRRVQLTQHEHGDLPTRQGPANWPDSGRSGGGVAGAANSPPPAYLLFTASSLRRDVAQSTVPFVDAQPVAPRPAGWLTGVGLYWRGAVGSGGFLALRVATVDLTSRVAVAVDEGEASVIQYESRKPISHMSNELES